MISFVSLASARFRFARCEPSIVGNAGESSSDKGGGAEEEEADEEARSRGGGAEEDEARTLRSALLWERLKGFADILPGKEQSNDMVFKYI
jgi:hypothetical protein